MPQKSKNKNNLLRNIIIYTALFIGVIILFDLTPFGGTIRYYAKWTSCGAQPYQVRGSGYFNDDTPSYYLPPRVNIFPTSRTLFCTAYDAEKHGFSANPEKYDFPVLRRENALCQKPTDPEPDTSAVFSPCDGE